MAAALQPCVNDANSRAGKADPGPFPARSTAPSLDAVAAGGHVLAPIFQLQLLFPFDAVASDRFGLGSRR